MSKRLQRFVDILATGEKVYNYYVIILYLADDILEYLQTNNQKELASMLHLTEAKTSILVQAIKAHATIMADVSKDVVLARKINILYGNNVEVL